MPRLHELRPEDPAELGGYHLLGRLGQGGQGVVYLGADADGTRVAVKTLHAEGTADPDHRQRFTREAEAARRVASFCTAAVLAADFAASPPYIVSEFVDGSSLREEVSRNGPLTGGDLHRVAVATATALVAIHEAGIVHRDLKPGNVLLGQGGARVIDFGVARASYASGTLTNSSIGTPGFMAPEQIAGDPVSPATDVFAWGAVIVFAATGREPFRGDTLPAVLHQVLNVDPDLVGVPEPLRALVGSTLRKDPARRPSSVDVLMTLLGRTERPTGSAGITEVMREATTTVSTRSPTVVGAPEPTAVRPPRRRARRWLLGSGVAALVVLVGLALVGAYLVGQGSVSTPAADGEDGSDEDEDEGPTIPADYAGTWQAEGIVADQSAVVTTIADGDNGLVLDVSSEIGWVGGLGTSATPCRISVPLTEEISGGFASDSASSDCEQTPATGATVRLLGSTIQIDLHDSAGETIRVVGLSRE